MQVSEHFYAITNKIEFWWFNLPLGIKFIIIGIILLSISIFLFIRKRNQIIKSPTNKSSKNTIQGKKNFTKQQKVESKENKTLKSITTYPTANHFDTKISKQFIDFLELVDLAFLQLKEKINDEEIYRQLTDIYQNYNIEPCTTPLSEIVQMDFIFSLVSTRLLTFNTNHSRGFNIINYFYDFFSKSSIDSALHRLNNAGAKIDVFPKSFLLFINFDIATNDNKLLGPLIAYNYICLLSDFFNDFFNYGIEKANENEICTKNHLLTNLSELLLHYSVFSETDNSTDCINTKTPYEDDSLDALLSELNSLVGLNKVKNEVNNLINLVKVRKLREAQGLKRVPLSLHLVFSGNPGTGKTTVARILGKIYKELGILSVGHLIETDRSGLVAGYVGQTAIKTKEIIDKAKGGILFIDEAYTLTSDTCSNDFGQEAINTLLKAMEDMRSDFIVIVAGYPKLMKQFLKSNPGLESRFNTFIDFEDYTQPELFDILKYMCEKNNYIIKKDSEIEIYEYINNLYTTRTDSFANARTIRNLFENAIKKHANRISLIQNPTREDLQTLLKEDFI